MLDPGAMTTSCRLSSTLLLIATGIVAIVEPGNRSAVMAQGAHPCASATSVDGNTPQHLVESPQTKSTATSDPHYLDALWLHRAQSSRNSPQRVVTPATADVGEIAVIRDAGDMLVKPNRFDLGNVGLRFTPNATGGYAVTRTAFAFRALGTSAAMGDDASREETLRFAFPFFGSHFTKIFVNSDGNVTFDAGDAASTARNISRLLQGPPRIAPMFADLDPSAGGNIRISSAADHFGVTWCSVPEYGSRRSATVQLTLFNDGAIELQHSSYTTLLDAIVAVSPGATEAFTPVDLSAGAIGEDVRAIGERFTANSEVDTVATMRRFYATHADDVDTVVLFTADPMLDAGAFAYELTVANDIRGLNLELFDEAANWGSNQRLQFLVMMDALSKYPDDPLEKVLGENNTVSILGQEFGHRWLAFLPFRDHTGRVSRQLLGRDAAHWSFFFDSDGSVVEGNDIEDLGGGNFRTVGAVNRFSLLDQYAMGLVDQSQVPPFFYVQNPFNVTPPRHAASSPEVGVTFSGTRRDVTIDDVVAAVGTRQPSSADSPRRYRQAFIYVVSADAAIDGAAIAKLDRIRIAWDQFLSRATDSRMSVDTRLSAR